MDEGRDVRRVSTTDGTTVETQRRGRGCGCWIALLVLLLAGGGATAYLGGMFALRQEVPLEPEAAVADLGKRWLMVPAEFTDWRMPEPRDVGRGKALFDTECAFCHGAAGRGDAALGRQMFPPAVGLHRDRTQNKTPGQLYYLIAHGLNYTGMPGWGRDFCTKDEAGKQYCGPHDQAEIWDLVAYVLTLDENQ